MEFLFLVLAALIIFSVAFLNALNNCTTQWYEYEFGLYW